MLTTEAFNALLKTLEEPPAHAVFVLATTDPQKVPATIKSRCVGVSFHRATSEELGAALKRIVEAEKIPIDDAAILTITSGVDGAFRDAVKLLEQVSFHKGKITEAVVRDLISVTDDSYRKTFLSAIGSRDTKSAFALVAQFIEDGKDVKLFLIDTLRDLQHMLVSLGSGGVVDGWETEDVRLVIRHLTRAYGEMKASPIAELPLEVAIVEICQPRVAQTVVVPQIIPKQESAQIAPKSAPKSVPAPVPTATPVTSSDVPVVLGFLTIEKLREHWADFIAELKPYNHSVAAVLRSARPASVEHGIVTIEAFYPFHKDKLSASQTKDILTDVLKKLFGEKVKVEIVLGKK